MEGVGGIKQIYDQINDNKTEEKKTEDQTDAFLKLLTTQLKHQDPFEPMQSGEFMVQIAQFTTATGMNDMKNSFSELSGALTSNMALQASSLVGREVLLPSNQVKMGSEGVVDAVVSLPQSTTGLQVTIHDAAGQVVRTIPMGMQAKGDIPFRWDGMGNNGQRVPPGQYTLSAQAMLDDQPGSVETMVYSRVESVSMGSAGTGVTLNIEGAGQAKLSQVKQVR